MARTLHLSNGRIFDDTDEDLTDEIAALVAADPALTDAFGAASGRTSDPTVSDLTSVAAGNGATFPLVLGDVLYVAASSDDTLKSFDISDRDAAPTLLDSLVSADGACHLVARGKYVFVWGQNGQLRSVDVSDPANLVEADSITHLTGQRCAIVGQYLVGGGPEAGGDANKLQVFDISDPTNMAAISTLVVGTVHRNIEAIGDHLVAVASRDTNTVHIVSILDPYNPVEIGSIASLTQTLTPLAADPGFFHGRPYLWAMSYGDGKLRCIDMSNPAAPTVAGTATGSTQCEWLTIEGRYGYVAIRSGKVDVWDLANPALPVLVQSFDSTATRLDRVAVANGRLYACDATATCYVLSVSGGRPMQPFPGVGTGDLLDRSGIIALDVYAPAADHTTTSTTLAEADASNLLWTFTAPRSGKVRLSIEAIWQGSASAWGYAALASGGVAVAGTSRGVGVDSGRQRRSISWLVTGLTPGTQYTYTLMLASGTAGQTTGIIANPTDGRGDVLLTTEAVAA